MMGVDYELFWTLNPKSLSPFIKAFGLKQKHEDFMAWNLGNYVREAVASAFIKNAKYPTKPHSEQSAPAEMTSDEIKSRVMQRAIALNARFEKEV